MSIFWLSFCDPDLPSGAQFLGVSMVRAADDEDPVVLAWNRGCNPGGEVMFAKLPAEAAKHIGDSWLHRILTKEDCKEFDKMLEESIKGELN